MSVLHAGNVRFQSTFVWRKEMVQNKKVPWLCPWFPKFVMLEFSVPNTVANGYWILDNQVRFRTAVIHPIQIRSEDLSLKDGRFVETCLCKYTLFLSSKIGNPINRISQIFQNRVIISKFWSSKVCHEAIPVENSHTSEVTFLFGLIWWFMLVTFELILNFIL